LKEKIEQYVNNSIKEWGEKGEFEKTSEYKIRMRQKSNKVKEFTQQALDKFRQEFLRKIKWDVSINGIYDADRETYKLSVPIANEIILHVPRKSAPCFKENQDKLIVNNPVIVYRDERWLLSSLDIINPTDNTVFSYNIGERNEYKEDDISEFDIEEVEIDEFDEGDDIAFEQYVLDRNLPKAKNKHPNGIAVVICNRDYKRTSNVDFAFEDGNLIRRYLIETFGFKPGNILFRENATKGDFELFFGTKDDYKGKLYNLVKRNESDVFIYYVGHGAPSSNDNKGYFVPVDCDPNYVNIGGYALEIFYNNLSKIESKTTTIILDACFSGVNIIKNISPIIIKVENPIVTSDNSIILTSSKDTEYSTWYNGMKHSLFTYFFIKAIHNRNADKNNDGKLTFAEIHDFVNDENEGVPYFARRLHSRDQYPQIIGKNFERIFIEYE
jgi:hypothetical protein